MGVLFPARLTPTFASLPPHPYPYTFHTFHTSSHAAVVHPIGAESSWNVDGELMSSNHVSMEVQRGLVDAFARGVEVEGSLPLLPL